MRPDLAAESDKLRLAGARRLGVSWGSPGNAINLNGSEAISNKIMMTQNDSDILK